MPICHIEPGEQMRRRYAPNNRERTTFETMLGQVDFAALFRAPGTIVQDGELRIDVQSKWSAGPPGSNNIQGQKGSRPNSVAFAGLLISGDLAEVAQNKQAEVLATAKRALKDSANDQHFRKLLPG